MENEILNNTIPPEENTTTENLANDSLALALDYQDRYYENVLKDTNTIIAQQQTIITNQEDMKEQNTHMTNGFDTIIIIISIIFIYNYIRNMITVK